MSRLFLLIFVLQLSATAAFSQNYVPADEGSKVRFTIKNFGINTSGSLSALKGNISFVPQDVTVASFNVSADVKTINTDNESRDKHLRGDDYFDAEKFPEIVIKSTQIVKSEKANAGWYQFNGTLTMHGITKNISFPFTATERDNNYLFEGSFEIKRLDYGVGGNSAVLSDLVKISLSVLAKKS